MSRWLDCLGGVMSAAQERKEENVSSLASCV